jgi:hypothetical protein
MTNKVFFNMAIKFRTGYETTYLIRIARNFAIFFASLIAATNVAATEFATRKISALPMCSEVNDLIKFSSLKQAVDKSPVLKAIVFDENVCATLNPDKTFPILPCKAAALYKSNFTTRQQVRELLTTPTYGNVDAITAKLLVAEKFAPPNAKALFPKYRENPTKAILGKILKAHDIILSTDGSGNPPIFIPPNVRFEPGAGQPKSLICDKENNCCQKKVDIYAPAANEETGKNVFVQRGNIFAVGAILSKSNRSACSMVLLSSSLAMTAAHCITSQTGFQQGSITTSGQSFENELDFFVWTPQGANPSMASAMKEKSNECKSKSGPQSNCDLSKLINFTKLKNVKLIYPSKSIASGATVPDITLFQFDQIDKIPAWGFALLPAVPPLPTDNTLTLIGFGTTELKTDGEVYGPQVGWLPYNETSSNGAVISSNKSPGSPKDSSVKTKNMPCPGDSGGGLFSGFQPGAPGAQMTLLGITSQNQGSVTGNKCSSPTALWISPHGFQKEICKTFIDAASIPDGLVAFCTGTVKP